MAKDNKKTAQKGELIVKNKKFKKSDILAFAVCLVAALIIWIYATNIQINDKKEFENLQGEAESAQQS